MTVAVHSVQRLEMLTAEPMQRSHGLKANKKSLHFMEARGSLLCSQDPATCPCPQPN
jgi:hypothetical protein